jgi:ABC-2 type transport system permease protein
MNTMHDTMRDAMPEAAPATLRKPLPTTLQWLIRREIWEHKGMLTWVPLVLAALMILAVLAVALTGTNGTIHVDGVTTSLSGKTVQLGERQLRQLADGIAVAAPISALPLYLSLAFMVFFYSLGALYDERRDRSILFWKSLPVSDTATVLSKAALALVGIPLLIIVVELVTSLILVTIGMAALAFKGINVFPMVLSQPQFWLGPLKVLSLLPVYALWALPTVGWLLLVSAWARGKVFLWAVGVPVMAMILLAWAEKGLRQAVDTGWLIEKFISRLLIGVMPGTWLMAGGVKERARDMDIAANTGGPSSAFDLIYHSSWAAVATAEMLAGAVAGIAMIAGAIWLRRRREEG